MYLDEVLMILDHLDEMVAGRSQGVWPKVPVVLLTATMGRPEESTAQVIAVQAKVVAAVNGRHVIGSDAGHYSHVDRPDLVAKYVRDVALGAL
jgi:pimeloyl-ACP methyl ester carboxylesterase